MSAPARIATGVTGTTYDDGGLAGGTTYRYVMRAVSATGCESGNSGGQSAGATVPVLPPPPNFVATATGTTAASITWSPVTGAAVYVVERSVNNSTFTPIGITPGLSINNAAAARTPRTCTAPSPAPRAVRRPPRAARTWRRRSSSPIRRWSSTAPW